MAAAEGWLPSLPEIFYTAPHLVSWVVHLARDPGPRILWVLDHWRLPWPTAHNTLGVVLIGCLPCALYVVVPIRWPLCLFVWYAQWFIYQPAVRLFGMWVWDHLPLIPVRWLDGVWVVDSAAHSSKPCAVGRLL
jgi:hypothetical protein